MKICCICGKPFTGYGNNPAPVEAVGECCDLCNRDVVMPRRFMEARKEQMRAAADALTFTPLAACESERLNALVGKVVKIEFTDGSVEAGVLHKDTPATYACDPNGDNSTLRGYYIDRKCGALHFKKSHVKSIRPTEAVFTSGQQRLDNLIGKSVKIKFVFGAEATGFLHKEKIIVDDAREATRYYVETPLKRVVFYDTDVKTIREA